MFYAWLHIAYAVMLCAAMWFNRHCWRTFTLSILVGIAVLTPIPWCYPVHLWYFKCFIVELSVIVGALAVRSPTSWAVIVFSVLLSAIHLVGAGIGPAEGVGPYKVFVPFLEGGELLICILLSHSARRLLERHVLRALYERQQNG